MLFNSISFILLFLPMAFAVFWLLASLQKFDLAQASLVGFSLLFYMWWNPAFLPLIIGSIIFNYAGGFLILKFANRPWQKPVLIAALAANLALLFFYKYLTATAQMLRSWGVDNAFADNPVILPLGISFFTFTQIGYLVDCQAGQVKSNRFLDYGLFVTFFPHLIAGPILHHREMMPQFSDRKTYRFQPENIAVGISFFIMGLFKKTVIAEYFMPYAKNAFVQAGHLSPLAAWCGVLAFTLQLYFDFSAYSDMAIGLARLFNLRFPANFNSPFKSLSIIEFWQRWHMTLTRYFTLYIYNPIALGIARRRAARGLSVNKQAIQKPEGFFHLIFLPTMLTMGLIGIWHGAGWTFFIFGSLHGLYLSINHAWRAWRPAVFMDMVPAYLKHGFCVTMTMIAVAVSLIFFRAESMPAALAMLANLIGIADPKIPTLDAPLYLLFIMAAGFAFTWFLPNTLQITALYKPTLSNIKGIPNILTLRPNVAWGCFLGIVASFAILGIGGTNEFLYFRF